MTTKALRDVLERIETRPDKDQEALAEFAGVIEERRAGGYRPTDDERLAIQKARETGLVPDVEVDAYWKRYDLV